MKGNAPKDDIEDDQDNAVEPLANPVNLFGLLENVILFIDVSDPRVMTTSGGGHLWVPTDCHRSLVDDVRGQLLIQEPVPRQDYL